MVEELNYATYQERQRREIHPNVLRQRASAAEPAGKFRRTDGHWEPLPYPGIAVVSMVEGEPENRTLSAQLTSIQQELRRGLDDDRTYYLLPPASFHQTLANTFSAERYQEHVVGNGVEEEYPRLIGEAFAGVEGALGEEPLRLRLIGTALFRTCIALLGDFPNREDCERVLRFRDQFYTNPSLRRIGLRRTRPFVGHVTLAYIERELGPESRQRLVEVVCGLNAQIAGQEPVFCIRGAEPRWYDDLSSFVPRPEYPRFSFVETNGV
jgi:hypothetical protein